MATKTYWGKYKGKKGVHMWHKITATSIDEARGKMLKGTRYTSSEVMIRTKKPKGV